MGRVSLCYMSLLARGHPGLVVALDSSHEGVWIKFDRVSEICFVDYVDLLVFFGLDMQTLPTELLIPRMAAKPFENPGFGHPIEKRLEEMTCDDHLPHTVVPGRILHLRQRPTAEESDRMHRAACNDFSFCMGANVASNGVILAMGSWDHPVAIHSQLVLLSTGKGVDTVVGC